MTRLTSSQAQVDAIVEDLMQRHEYEAGAVDLANVASVMLQLRETLPASYCTGRPSPGTPHSWHIGAKHGLHASLTSG